MVHPLCIAQFDMLDIGYAALLVEQRGVLVEGLVGLQLPPPAPTTIYPCRQRQRTEGGEWEAPPNGI